MQSLKRRRNRFPGGLNHLEEIGQEIEKGKMIYNKTTAGKLGKELTDLNE